MLIVGRRNVDAFEQHAARDIRPDNLHERVHDALINIGVHDRREVDGNAVDT